MLMYSTGAASTLTPSPRRSCRAGFHRTSCRTSATRLPTASGIMPRAMPRPLALFDGPRTDFSLARLRHYTGTDPDHFQHFILFTNYVRYVDEFVRFAIDELRREDSPYTGAFGARRLLRPVSIADAEAQIAAGHGGGTRCRPTI